MNEKGYNKELINDYLLGSLPEAEVEYFDELSFTDEMFGEALITAEQDLVDAYIHRKLVGLTLKKFETHYLASPLRREKVNFAKAFQSLAEQSAAETSLKNPVAEELPLTLNLASFFSGINNFITGKRVLQWGFAGTVLAALFLSIFWIINNQRALPEKEVAGHSTTGSPTPEPPLKIEQQQPSIIDAEKEAAANANKNVPTRLKPEREQESKNTILAANRAPQKEKPLTPRIVASFFLAPPRRTSNQIPNFRISEEVSTVSVRLKLEVDDYPAYHVRLTDESSGKNLWQSNILKAQGKNENKYLNIQIPAKLLKSQIYSFAVSGVTDDKTEILANYAFRAVLK